MELSDCKLKVRRDYGFSYLGCKSRLCDRMSLQFPKRKNFYDLFCGGGAVTDYCISHGMYEHYYMNDINPLVTELFINAIKGRYDDERRWISREDFMALRDEDPIIAFCWAFNNSRTCYIYSKGTTEYKKAFHYAVAFNDFSLLDSFDHDLSCEIKRQFNSEDINRRRLTLSRVVSEKRKDIKDSRLQALEHIEKIKRIRRHDPNLITATNLDYSSINIEDDSFIYCDIPYREAKKQYCTETPKTRQCIGEFNYGRFYEWALAQTEPVLISEYSMPDSFIKLSEVKLHSTWKFHSSLDYSNECTFIPKTQVELWEHITNE